MSNIVTKVVSDYVYLGKVSVYRPAIGYIFAIHTPFHLLVASLTSQFKFVAQCYEVKANFL